jgi:8-oxo-dGTP diphosphatase
MATVTAAILVRNGKILIARRPAADRLANKWEFPGGKVEEGETAEACLARELREELGIEAHIGSFLGESCYRYEHASIRLLAFLAYWDTGVLAPMVHDEIRWASLDELEHYDFAPADIPFVKKLINGDLGVSLVENTEVRSQKSE